MLGTSHRSVNLYSRTSISLHWSIAIGIFLNLKSGLGFDAMEAAHASNLRAAIDLHKSIGITLLGLVIIRVFWRATHRPPAPLASLEPWERKLAAVTHYLLYALLALVPLTGWLHDSAWSAAESHPLVLFHTFSFFRFPFFSGMDLAVRNHWHTWLGQLHGLLADFLIVALTLHVLGAVKHQWLDGKAVMQRMWF